MRRDQHLTCARYPEFHFRGRRVVLKACDYLGKYGKMSSVKPAKKNSEVLPIVYSCLLAIVPVAHLYSSPLAKVTLAEMIFLLLLLLAVPGIISSLGRDSFLPPRTPTVKLFFGFLFATTLALLFTSRQVSDVDVIARFSKLALWATVTTFLSWRLFRPRVTLSAVQVVAALGSIYLIVQWFAWNARSIFLPFVIEQELFPPIQDSYRDVEALMGHFEYFYFRPASFFGEPAYFGYYALLTLILILFFQRREVTAKQWILTLLVSVAAILSTSTTALYLIPLTWVIWVVHQARSGRFGRFSMVTLGVGCGLAVAWILRGGSNGSLGLASSLESSMAKLGNWQSSARLGGSLDSLEHLTWPERIFGVGMGNEDIALNLTSFYNDVTTVVLGTGILGFGFLLAYWRRLWMIAVPGAKLLVICYVALSFGEQFLYQGFSFVFLAYIIYGSQIDSLAGRDDAILVRYGSTDSDNEVRTLAEA